MGHVRLLKSVCVSRTSAILFSMSTGVITDYCQSAKDTDTYFKSQLYVEDLGPPKRGWDSNPHLLD